MERVDWELKAREAFENYLEDLKASLPHNASFADMERAIMKYSPEIMRSTLEGMANSEAFSPREERNT